MYNSNAILKMCVDGIFYQNNQILNFKLNGNTFHFNLSNIIPFNHIETQLFLYKITFCVYSTFPFKSVLAQKVVHHFPF